MSRRILGSSLFLALIISSNSISFSAEKHFERNISVAEDVLFSMDYRHRGTINIRTADVDRISISAVITHNNEKFFEDVEILVEESPESVSLVVNFNPSFKISRTFSMLSQIFSPENGIEFDIILPVNASLNIKNHSSHLNIEAPRGSVSIESHRGNGQIVGIQSDFELSTHGGEFDIEISQIADLSLKTHKGDIRAVISNAQNFDVYGRTHSGTLNFSGDYDIPYHQSFRDSSVLHRVGTGAHRIRLDTHQGDIAVNFLN